MFGAALAPPSLMLQWAPTRLPTTARVAPKKKKNKRREENKKKKEKKTKGTLPSTKAGKGVLLVAG